MSSSSNADGFEFEIELEDEEMPTLAPARPQATPPAREAASQQPAAQQPAAPAPQGAPAQPAPPQPQAAPARPPVDLTKLREQLSARGINDLYAVRIIEFLLTEGRMAIEQLLPFLAEAEKTSVPELAAESGMLNEDELLAIRAQLSGMDIVRLGEVEIEENLAKLISPDQALDWQALPYSRNDIGQLLVAIADPENIAARDAIHKALPKEEIVFYLARPSELARLINQIYDPEGAARVSALIADTTDEEDADEEGEEFVVRASNDGKTVRLVNDIISQAAQLGASDIHIEPDENDTAVRFRIDGVLKEMSRIPRSAAAPVVARIKTMTPSMRTDVRTVPQDGRIAFRLGATVVDLRVTTLPAKYGEEVVMRLLDPTKAMLSLEELGMSEDNLARYTDGITAAHGCCFITGPTGSGKSTTLYSSLARVVTPEKKLISIENPIEYRLEGITQIDVSGGSLMDESQQQRMTFAKALKAILRADPDIIMVGEIRDEETAHTAIEAAQTGHFLYSTLHTNDALSAVTRLEQLGVPRFLIADATRVIVAQRLVRRLCSCKVPLEADEAILRTAKAPAWCFEALAKQGGQVQIYRHSAEGCARCNGVGYKGRTGIHEVILMTPELESAIVAGKPVEDLEKIARSQGMGSLRDDVFKRVWDGTTSIEEANRVVV